MTSSAQIAVIAGTRPEIIKLAPVVSLLGDRAFTVHSGQHYDPAMSSDLYPSLGISPPDVTLNGVGGASRGSQVATAMAQLRSVLEERRPAAVVVQGDTNTTVAGALAAAFAGIPVIHVEAGLRSFDRLMPEELNRVLAGAAADMHCAATAFNRAHLLAEAVPATRVVVTGNTIVEATQRVLARLVSTRMREVADLPAYALVTLHRPENVDTPDALRRVWSAVEACELPALWVHHPRTRPLLSAMGLHSPRIRFVEPTTHEDFIHLARDAAFLVSDSGGVQEEASILKKPLLVVRRSTERSESITAGFAQLIAPGQDLEAAIAVAAARREPWTARLQDLPSPFGDGHASERIADIAASYLPGH
ncbi:MAG: mnaA2 [Microbacterium sp.]|jgi:UDP-N-acetylglucosamine 2-epimerase (non-hydrolysing)|uniref:non-hydrolyzing UDP-N-acetylglucosamine 2-epimerase n=1 Tax=Microbacterium sp. TaxID=51671 RepID=UPI00261EAED0|nr:UDP-N-acetylglucosamine 2-epimerase (non-hydrolyzing) [Microbacterium sp.]MDF2559100.1 mnaA2 [Microbacterium sp.]